MLRRPVLALTSLLLLAVMAVQLVQVASFEVRRMALRREMKQQIRQGLPQHELVRFTFSSAEYEALEKEDGGREFWVDGHIYDVVRSMKEADGKVNIEAVDDRDEARLMAGLNDLLQNGMACKGMGRDRARAVVAALAAALPIWPVRLAVIEPGRALRYPAQGDPVLERASGDLFHPPRS
jgi:hypothetical protein